MTFETNLLSDRKWVETSTEKTVVVPTCSNCSTQLDSYEHDFGMGMCRKCNDAEWDAVLSPVAQSAT